MKIRVAGELFDSLSNGPGMRYVLFTQGCTMHCPGCQNTHTWDLDGGDLIDIKEIVQHIKESPFIDGVTISGGDPFEQSIATYYLIKRIREELPKLNIMLYTGRTLRELKRSSSIYVSEILYLVDYLVDGKFEQNNTAKARNYTGSANQKIYNMKTEEEIWFY